MRPPAAASAIASLSGLGFLPLAPGTWGSLAGLPLYLSRGNMPLLSALLLLIGALAVWSCGRFSRQRGERDPRQAVIDEAFGMGLVLAALPREGWLVLAAGFLLFRAFDVLKPYPLRRLEKLPGGWGIVADDAGAAAYAILSLHALHTFRLP